MDDFILKPLHPEELTATLLRWVRPGKKVAAPPAEGLPGMPPIENDAVPDNLPGFDFTNILKMLNGNRQQLAALLVSIADSMAGMPGEIADKVKQADFQGARELAHRIKGTAGNLGAMSLHAAAARLERELKAGQCDPGVLAAFGEEFERALSAIATLRKSGEQAEAPPGPCGDAAAFQEGAMRLDDLLAGNDFVPDELLDGLERNLPSGKREAFGELRKHVRAIRYTEARGTLRALLGISGLMED
jgi:HPt (histidine-containing phosphotransfer) domain-containing protein